MAKKKDLERIRALNAEVSRMADEVKRRGGDFSAITSNVASDSVAAISHKALHGYFKDNPKLSEEFPELYQHTSTGGQSIYTNKLREYMDQNQQNPSKEANRAPDRVVNNIIPRGGDSYTKAALRSFFGASDAYAYNVRDSSGVQSYLPASSPKDAYQKLQGSSHDLKEGNSLFERMKKKVENKKGSK